MYKIEETPCYPNAWKVIHVGFKEDNAACNYFPTKDAAKAEVIKCERHNKRLHRDSSPLSPVSE